MLILYLQMLINNFRASFFEKNKRDIGLHSRWNRISPRAFDSASRATVLTDGFVSLDGLSAHFEGRGTDKEEWKPPGELPGDTPRIKKERAIRMPKILKSHPISAVYLTGMFVIGIVLQELH